MAIVATSRRVYQAPSSIEERDRIMDGVAVAGQCGPKSVLVAAIQPFAAGGFEGVVRWHEDKSEMPVLPWDLADEHMDRYRRVRAEPENRDENSIESSRRRTKRMIRWHCKNIGVDHLLTFTTRQLSNTPGKLWRMWQRFTKLYRKATGEELAYVALPEPHSTNPSHWHLHVATVGYFKLKIARPIWWQICGGRGQGNVQIEYLKVREGGWKAHKIACYVSKYITKCADYFGPIQ